MPLPLPDPDLVGRFSPYLSAPSSTLLDVSSDNHLLISSREGDTPQLFLLDHPLATPLLVATASSGRFTPDDEILAITDHDGDERFQLGTLTDPTARNTSPVYTSDGRTLIYASTARDGVDTDLWWSDGETAASAKLLHQVTGTWTPLELSADDRRLLALEHLSSTRVVLHVLDVTTGKEHALSGADDATTDARFGVHGVIYALSDRASKGHARVRRLWSLAGTTWSCLTCDLDAEIDAIAVSPSGGTLAFTADLGGASALFTYDVKKKTRKRARNAPIDGVIAPIQFTSNTTLALGWSSPVSPGEVGTYDLAKQRLTKWTDAEVSGVDPAMLVWPNHPHAGDVPLTLYSPSPGTAAGRAPVIVMFHGGPEDGWRPRWQPEVQFLVSLGYAVVQPDVRGSTGHGRAYAEADDGAARAGVVDDVAAVLDWIATQPDLDARRVSVLGTSYGGWLALAAGARFGDRLRAVVDIVGMPDLATFLAHTAPWRRALRRAEYGDDLASFAVTAIALPLFVAAGANDPRVPAADVLSIASPDTWTFTAPDDGHLFARTSNLTTLWGSIATFLAQYVIEVTSN